MDIPRSTINSNSIKRTTCSANNSPVILGTEESSKKATIASTPLVERSLSTREISITELTFTSIPNEDEFKIGLKASGLVILEGLSFFIQKNIDPNFKSIHNEDASLQTILEKNGELIFFINSHPQVFCKLNSLMDTLTSDIIKRLISLNVELFMRRNLLYTISVYIELLRKYNEFNNERIAVSQLKLNDPGDHNTVKGLDVLIKNGVDHLSSILNQTFYAFIRDALGTKNLNTKIENFLIYIGKASNVSSSDYVSFFYKNSIVLFSNIANIGNYIAKLQIFLNLLIQAQKSPKTIHSLNILLAKCSECLLYFNDDVAYIERVFSKNVPYAKDFYSIKKGLEGLEHLFMKLLPKNEPSVSNEWLPDSFKNQKPRPRKTFRQKPATSTVNPRHLSNATQQPLSSSPVNSTLPTQASQELPPKEILSEIKEFPLKDESVEREESELFESIRQVFEVFRKKKLEQKAAKENKKEKAQDEIGAPITVNHPKLIKLSPKNEFLLEQVFNLRLGHGVLSGLEIENLIEALEGKVVGMEGSRYQIRWSNEDGILSKKNGGTYEVAHEGPFKNHLLKNQVKKVRGYIITAVELKIINVVLPKLEKY